MSAINLTLTIDLAATSALDFKKLASMFAALSENGLSIATDFRPYTHGGQIQTTDRGTVAPPAPPPDGDKPAEPPLPMPAPAARTRKPKGDETKPEAAQPVETKPEPKPEPKPEAAPAAEPKKIETPKPTTPAGDPVDAMSDAELLVELRRVGLEIAKTSGGAKVADVLKEHNASKYGNLDEATKRVVLRKLNAIAGGK